MKLHIGCGPKYLPGFIHVDVQKYDHIDINCNLFDLLDHVKPNSADEIYACHVVEHVSRHRIEELFNIFYTVLKPGGVLRMSVPDIEKSIELYVAGKYPLYPSLYGQFWGGQRNEFDYHTCGFDFKTMKHFTSLAGFCDLARYDWRDFLPSGYDDYSRSYLPHMDFDNGTLLSLNVTMRKRLPLLVFCVGGFTNAINSVIASALFAKKHNMKMFVHWVEGYIALDAKLTDIIDIKDPHMITQVSEQEFEKMLANNGSSCTKITHNQNVPQFQAIHGPCINPKLLTNLNSLDELITTRKDCTLVVFHTDCLPKYVLNSPTVHFDAFFSMMDFAERLKRKATIIYDSFPEPKPRMGIHLRGTDILSLVGKTPSDLAQFAIEVAKTHSNDWPILIATDDKDVIGHLQRFHNSVFVFCNHESYVTKRDASISWYHEDSSDHIKCGSIVHDNKTFKEFSSSNVYRPLAQIEAGIIDLLLLSRMNQLACYEPTSGGSTYFHFAALLGNYVATKSLKTELQTI